jgi:hypothetical protein
MHSFGKNVLENAFHIQMSGGHQVVVLLQLTTPFCSCRKAKYRNDKLHFHFGGMVLLEPGTC